MEKKRRGGWPKRDPDPAERVVLSCRVTPELKTRLDQMVAENGRSLAQEIELRLTQTIENDAALGGPRLAALLRTLAALASDREDESWLDNPDIFNMIVDRWTKHFDTIRPQRSTEEQGQIELEFEELRQAIEEATPLGKVALRRHARFLAQHANTLEPEWRARYAALASTGDDEAA
jgi:hypothetical protein